MEKLESQHNLSNIEADHSVRFIRQYRCSICDLSDIEKISNLTEAALTAFAEYRKLNMGSS